MIGKRRLQPADRDFFRLVARAAFANPFGDERAEFDLRILDATRGLPRSERVRRLHERVHGALESLDGAGAWTLPQFAGDADHELLRTAVLFDLYHRLSDDFDELILEQGRRGEKQCPVPFANDAFAELRRRGFEPAEAWRFFAMFYQLRRAFFFIDRGLVGRSASTKELRRRLWNNVITHDIGWYERYLMDRMEDFSTLLLGETGTGKGAAAAAIGRSGFIPFDAEKKRFVESYATAFVAINLSQYPETIIESELFGHRKGAFTGAIDDRDGVFARCSPHGAIFLDEIGDVSTTVQIKLLQVLQERCFTPIGGHRECRFRGRAIAATNRSLAELLERGSFRDDFFYRISSDIIRVPPLRDRLREDPGEMDELLAAMLERLTGECDGSLVARVRERIDACLPGGPVNYDWPGNVRELEQCVRRILLTNHYEPFTWRSKGDAQTDFLKAMDEGTLSTQELLTRYCRLLYRRYGVLTEVARITGLDRRTVKKYVGMAEGGS